MKFPPDEHVAAASEFRLVSFCLHVLRNALKLHSFMELLVLIAFYRANPAACAIFEDNLALKFLKLAGEAARERAAGGAL